MDFLSKFFALFACAALVSACGNGNGPAAETPETEVRTIAEYEAEARETIDAENMDDVLDALEAEIAADEAATP